MTTPQWIGLAFLLLPICVLTMAFLRYGVSLKPAPERSAEDYQSVASSKRN